MARAASRVPGGTGDATHTVISYAWSNFKFVMWLKKTLVAHEQPVWADKDKSQFVGGEERTTGGGWGLCGRVFVCTPCHPSNMALLMGCQSRGRWTMRGPLLCVSRLTFAPRPPAAPKSTVRF